MTDKKSNYLAIFKNLCFTFVVMILLLGASTPLSAALSIVSITGTNSTCKDGASVTITVTGHTGSILYTLLDANKIPISNKQEYDSQPTHTFTGLPGGTYYASVSDESGNQDAISATGATVTVSYTDMVITAPSAMVGCSTATAKITVTATRGSGTYIKYRLYNGGGYDLTQTSAVFNNVPRGAYTIEVTDNCGAVQTTSTNVNVTSATVKSFNGNNAWVRYSDAGNCSSALSIYTEMGSIGLNPNSITEFDRQHFYWCYRYPVGAGGTVYGLDASKNLVATTLADGRNFASPISTSMLPLPPTATNDFINANVNTNAAEIIIYDDCGNYFVNDVKFVKQKYNNALITGILECSNGLSGSLLLRSYAFYGPYCYPLTVTIKNLSDVVVGTYTLPTYTSPHYEDAIDANLTPGEKYKVTVVDSKGLNLLVNTQVTIPTAVPNASILTPANSMYYYNSRTFSVTFGASISNTTLTYEVQSTTAPGVPANFSGTVVGTATSSAGPYEFKGPNSDGSWPAGQYTVKFTTNPSNNCMNNVLYNFTVADGVQASFNKTATVITPRCGRFDVDLKAISNTSGIKAYIKEGPSGVNTIKTFTSTSGGYTVKFDNLSYGTYKIGIVSSAVTAVGISTNKHLIDSIMVTYSANDALTIDPLKTGGYICTGTTTNLVITAASASGSALQYSYLPSGSSTYVDWQNSNSFSNVAAGTYPVRVKDECGNVTTYNAVVTDKPAPYSTTNPVCEGEPVTMGIAVPGGITYTWYKRQYTSSGYVDNQIYTSASPYYKLPNNVQVTDSGTYVVIVTTSNASCPTVESHFVLGVKAKPTATISYANSTYCTSDVDPTPTLSNVVGTNVVAGTYNASPAGLSINASTGKIDLSESKAGNYTVTYSFHDDNCHNTSTTSVRVNGITLVVNGPIIAYKPNKADITTTAVTAGTSASEGGNIRYQYFTDATGTNTLSDPKEISSSGIYYIQAISASGCLSEIKPVEVIIKANYWVGTHTSNWGSDFNWSDVRIPLTGEDIEFATQENNPGNPAKKDLELDADYTVGNLVNATDFATVIPANKSLVVQGKVTGSETSADKIVIKASADGTEANGSLIMDCSNQGTIKVQGTVQMYSRGKASGVYSTLDNIEGSPTKGLPLETNYLWQQFGVPVKTTTAPFNESTIARYNEKKNDVTNTAVGPNYWTDNPTGPAVAGMFYDKWDMLGSSSELIPFAGYIMTQDAPKTVTMKGELVLCDQSITLTREAARVPGAYNGNVEIDRWALGQNVFGNSFTAAIPIEKITFPEGVEKTVYLYNTGSFAQWQSQIGSQPNGTSYQNITNAGNYKAIPYNTANEVYNQIPSMQGFLLKHTNANGSDGVGTPITMTLPYADLTKNKYVQTAPKAPLSYLKVNLTSESTRDILWLFSQYGTTDGFDDGWDGEKSFGTPTAFVYTKDRVAEREVNTSDNLLGTYVYIRPNADSLYTLTINKSNLDTQYPELYFVDLLTNEVISLDNETTTYTFTASVNDTTEKRFQIIGHEPVATGNKNTDYKQSLSAYAYNNNLTVQNKTNTECTIHIFDMVGRKISSSVLAPFETQTSMQHLPTGVYFVKMETVNYTNTAKVTIK